MAGDPRPIPLSLWVLAFFVLQFAFSCLPPPRPRPPNNAETSSAPGGTTTTQSTTSTSTTITTTTTSTTTTAGDACLAECYDQDLDPKGATYDGCVSTTVSGRTCQAWASQTPHKHRFTSLEENYCRNPDGEPRPWCYTTDSKKRWEFCEAPICAATTTTTTTGLGGETTPGGTTTAAGPPLNWETATTSVDIEDDTKVLLCEVVFSFALDQGVVLKDIKEKGCTSGTSSDGTLKFAGRHQFNIESSTGINLECTASAALVYGVLDEGLFNKTLNCSALADQCLTDAGDVFPSKCVFPFIHNGRKFHACTDVGSPNPSRLWCPTEVDDSGSAVDGSAGLCNTKCGYCAGSPVSRDSSSTSCGYKCLINPDKVMEPLDPAEMDSSFLTSPIVTENVNDPLAIGNKLGDNQFKFDIGQPGVFLSCANGFNHFPCYQDIFVNCTGSYKFTAYHANITTSTIVGKIKDNVENTHFGCGPCPKGFNYRAGYESRTYETNLGSYGQVSTIDDCEDLCERVGCLSLIYSPRSMTCKLHSSRVDTPSMPTYKDYRVCVKEEETSCQLETCCKKVRLSSTGGTADQQSARLGVYEQDGEYNGKPAFRQETGSKVLFYAGTDESGWVVGSSYSSAGGLRTGPEPSSQCPDDETFNWEYYMPGTANTWLPDETMEVSCLRENDCGFPDSTLRTTGLKTFKPYFCTKTPFLYSGLAWMSAFSSLDHLLDDTAESLHQEVTKILKQWTTDPTFFNGKSRDPIFKGNKFMEVFEKCDQFQFSLFPDSDETKLLETIENEINNNILDLKSWPIVGKPSLPNKIQFEKFKKIPRRNYVAFFAIRTQLFKSQSNIPDSDPIYTLKDQHTKMKEHFYKLLAPCLLQQILKQDPDDEFSAFAGFQFRPDLLLEKPTTSPHKPTKLYRWTFSKFLNGEIMPYELVGSTVKPLTIKLNADGEIDEEGMKKLIEDTKGKNLKFKKFLSHSVGVGESTYLTKDELTKLWQGPVSTWGWVDQNEQFWDDDEDEPVYDTGLVVTIHPETRARKIDEFNDFMNGQREALFPVGTAFQITSFKDRQTDENEYDRPRYVLEITEIKS